MTIPPYLHKTGLPASVLHTIHILSGAHQLKALALVADYEREVTTISRKEIEKAWRERQAKLALEKRDREAKQRKPASVTHLRVAAAERSLLR
jgi:hypothetical protein